MNNDLAATFLSDHESITKKINLLSEIYEKNSFDLDLYNKIKWEIERHCYLEEKALFLYCETENFVNSKFVKELLKQHDNILFSLQEFKKASHLGTKYDVKVLKIFLENHIEFEKHFFYKLFDEKLSEDAKRFLKILFTKSNTMGFYPIKKIRDYALKNKHIKCKY